MHILNIDFETYSKANLPRVGAWAYSRDPSTEAICMAYSLDGETPRLWRHGDPCPFSPEFLDNCVVKAYNVFFELSIWRNVLGWREPATWADTAAQVAALSLPRSLDGVSKALGLDEDYQKDQRGKKLIQLLCKPQRDGRRLRDATFTKELEDYCVQDVVVEQAVDQFLIPLNAREKVIFELDLKINRRGVAVDVFAAKKMQEVIEACTERMNAELAEITGGALINTNSHMQVRDYLAETCGYELPNYQKATLEAALREEGLPPLVRRILEIRQSTGKTSTAKITKLLAITDTDGRAYGLLRYHGASTGRWSGNLFQPQNLPRPSFDDTDECVEFMCQSTCIDEIEMLYGDPMEAVSSCIRSLITVSNPKTHELICSDYSSIEPRVLAWLCGNDELLAVFVSGKDVYKYQAARMFNMRYEDIGDNSIERLVGKVAILALGYGGGAAAFMHMAAIYALDITERQALYYRDAYRESNPQVVNFWRACNTAAMKSIQTPGRVFAAGRIAFKVFNGFLFCRLPSGRALSYYHPHIGIAKPTKAMPWKSGPEIRFWGVDSKTKRFCQQSTYGGKLVENITQALARDVMADAMVKLEAAGAPVVLTVHDEVISEVPRSRDMSVEEFESIMMDTNPWAEGIPVVAAKGYKSVRYRK